MTVHFPFDNSYARLDAPFLQRTLPTPVAAPRLIKLNRPLAVELGLDPDALDTPEGAEILTGNRIPMGAEPIAAAYAGHQFGNFVPQLGDGRAILLGEVVDRTGRRRDIQLKGSGPTPFSRGGDGRAALGPVLREYIVSEAMAALGIPTTRALAAAKTGDSVWRDGVLPGAVLTRVAASHIRIGTFQFFAARGDTASLRRLADHAIARHDPEAAEAPKPYRAFLEGVARRQAFLVAQWMGIGFIHGVMNTDNMSIAGETIDYGPCAFMDVYDPATVFSSIDRRGRYAYANQPGIAQWNLTRLAECLLPLLAPEEDAAIEMAQEILAGFSRDFDTAYGALFRAKIGLGDEREGDEALVQDLLGRMASGKADFTLLFRGLAAAAESPTGDGNVRSLFEDPRLFDDWAGRWRARLGDDGRSETGRAERMRHVNPAIVPRNHLVETAISAAVTQDDFAPFEALVSALARPYEDRAIDDPYAAEPPPSAETYRTFCGT